MTIRSTVVVGGAHSSGGDQFEVDVGPRPVVVRVVEAFTDDNHEVLVRATARWSVSPTIAPYLHALARGEDITEEGPGWEGSAFKRATFYDRQLPERYRDFTSQVGRELSGAARHAFGLLRWRYASEGGPRPFLGRGTQFTLDGETWHQLPARGSVYASVSQGLVLTDAASAEVGRLLAADVSEPVAQELLREARSIMSPHSRASLVIAIAALEVGLKDFIASQVPETTWILEESPSPPTVRMLREYLPKLAAVSERIVGSEAIPGNVLAVIKDGNDRRNRVVHVGAEAGDMGSTGAVVDAVEQCLHLLDFYAGHEWAWSMLDTEARDLLR